MLHALGTRAALYVVLCLAALPFLLPGLWMITASLTTRDQIFTYPPRFIPTEFHFENYTRAFEMQPFAQQYINSLYIAAIVSVATVVVASMAGYGFARLRFPGRSVIFIVILTGLFVPFEVTMIPLFRMTASLGVIDTHWPLIVIPICSGPAVISTFVMRQAFLSLPRDLEDAARIDGLGWFRTYWKVALPTARPSIAVVVVLSAWNSWNMFLEPLIFLRSPEKFTLPLALTQFIDPFTDSPAYEVKMAATTMTLLLVLAIFVAAQRHVVSGLTAGSVKG